MQVRLQRRLDRKLDVQRLNWKIEYKIRIYRLKETAEQRIKFIY